MLTIAQPHPVQTIDATQTSGGFLWWYADLETPAGDGLVVIWSLGLPFLPGSREYQPAFRRPAVSVAHYVKGQQQLYLLQDYPSHNANIAPFTGCARIGKSTYEFLSEDSNVVLQIDLDEPIPNSQERLRGKIRITGPTTGLEPNTGTDTAHIWAPKTAHADGNATIIYDDKVHVMRGSAYVDSNISSTPLPSQGIQSWQWGRITFPQYTVVYYEVTGVDGARQRYLHRQTRGLPLERLSGRLDFAEFERGTFGLATPRSVLIGASALTVLGKTVHLLEDGPFYARGLVRATDSNGQEGAGFCETVAPSKIDRPWQRPFVRMRTHRVGGSNSFFLPLFSGPRSDRAKRFLRAFAARNVAV